MKKKKLRSLRNPLSNNQSFKDIKLSNTTTANNTPLKKPHKNQHNKHKQLRIDTTIVSSGYTRPHTHGLGIWNNPRVPMTVRVDKKLKLAFNEASKAFSGSTCSAIEYIMAAYVGAYQQQIEGAYPTLTTNPITIDKIVIERNLKERRSAVVDAEPKDVCMVGKCGRNAVDSAVNDGKMFRLCGFHAEAYAGGKGWSFL